MADRREIVLINKHEGGPPSLLEKFEKLSKIIAAVAVPFLIGVGGWWIQDALSRRDTDQDYVELAISILSKPQNETSSELREWATNLLAETSPIEIPPGLKQKLGGGEIRLPALLGSPEFTPARTLADNDERAGILGSISLLDFLTGRGTRSACTGWLVGPKTVLTAGYCVSGGQVEKAVSIFDYADPRYSEDTRVVELRLPAEEVNAELNFAILSFSKSSSFAGIPLSVSRNDPAVGDSLFILHHPEGRELSFSVRYCRILSVEQRHITHDCDTANGSGGAPLIDARTLEVVGMHLSANRDATKTGVRISALVEESELLQSILDSAE